jgi:cytochrome c oxidase subunit II
MNFDLPVASPGAAETDQLLGALLLISLAVLVLVFGLMALYGIRYRARSTAHRGAPGEKSWRFEIAWTTVTIVAFFALDVWGADVYMRQSQTPAHAMKVYIIGKQWMWKAEHEGGQREINALHVPTGRDVQLIMTSEDVIHDFSVPAFRVKRDVLPGRYETLWFHPNRAGTYPLYCDQFCGTGHSEMVGDIVVLKPVEFSAWLSANGENGGTLADQGHTLFMRYGCSGCHETTEGGGGGTVLAPPLIGLYGSLVPLADRTVLTADDKYIRDSILMPASQIVASYPNLLPSYAGQISEENLVKVIAYIKSMAGETPR